MKVAVTMRVPTIEHADMPRCVDIKNRPPIADGRIASTVITVVSPVQRAVIEQITVHVSLPLIVEE